MIKYYDTQTVKRTFVYIIKFIGEIIDIQVRLFSPKFLWTLFLYDYLLVCRE